MARPSRLRRIGWYGPPPCSCRGMTPLTTHGRVPSLSASWCVWHSSAPSRLHWCRSATHCPWQAPLPLGRFLAPGRLARLSSGFLSAVAQHCLAARPPHRLHTGLALDAPFGLLLPNIGTFSLLRPPAGRGKHPALGPVLSVEIKPKCGFLPTSAAIGPSHALKKQVSRYQLHQHLKLAAGQCSQA